MKIAYFTSNRTTFPPQPNQIAASTTVTLDIINHLSNKHDITLYAAEGSQVPNVRIVTLGLKPFKLDSNISDSDWVTKAVVGMKQMYIGEVLKNAHQYDIIHFQTEPVYLGMPYTGLVKTPILFTVHNIYHSFEQSLYNYYQNRVSVSALSLHHAQSFPMSPQIPYIYNGIKVGEYPMRSDSKGYFLFIGRLAQEKGIEVYIQLAQQHTNQEFYILGQGSTYYENLIETAVKTSSNIKFFKGLPRNDKAWIDIVANAKALLSPLQWEEPFGLVSIEAMACGTPVIAFACGAMPEIIKDKETGYLVNTTVDNSRGSWYISAIGIEGFAEAMRTLAELSEDDYRNMRKASRKQVENHFTAAQMAENYEKLYQSIIEKSK